MGRLAHDNPGSSTSAPPSGSLLETHTSSPRSPILFSPAVPSVVPSPKNPASTGSAPPSDSPTETDTSSPQSPTPTPSSPALSSIASPISSGPSSELSGTPPPPSSSPTHWSAPPGLSLEADSDFSSTSPTHHYTPEPRSPFCDDSSVNRSRSGNFFRGDPMSPALRKRSIFDSAYSDSCRSASPLYRRRKRRRVEEEEEGDDRDDDNDEDEDEEEEEEGVVMVMEEQGTETEDETEGGTEDETEGGTEDETEGETEDETEGETEDETEEIEEETEASTNASTNASRSRIIHKLTHPPRISLTSHISRTVTPPPPKKHHHHDPHQRQHTQHPHHQISLLCTTSPSATTTGLTPPILTRMKLNRARHIARGRAARASRLRRNTTKIHTPFPVASSRGYGDSNPPSRFAGAARPTCRIRTPTAGSEETIKKQDEEMRGKARRREWISECRGRVWDEESWDGWVLRGGRG